ncbi:MAG: primosomal protein N' [Methylacidiphilales bacterium]|nr:primosomal protein N' [Candidatus Methylacidiphilales bacterium]MDW8350016.1 primosomal protein N' [Verrucomicrobiae bacterium]
MKETDLFVGWEEDDERPRMGERGGMGRIARVVPESHVDGVFDYLVPERWRGELTIGAKVRVSLGRRMVCGYIVDWAEEGACGRREGLKEISGIADSVYHLPAVLVEMAQWIAEYYCAPLGAVMRCVLPQVVANERGPLLRLRVELVRCWDAEAVEREGALRSPQQRAALSFLKERGGAAWIHEAIEQSGVRREVWRRLEKKGWVRIFAAAKGRETWGQVEGIRGDGVELNAEQRAALQAVFAEGKPVLLWGVTGSGKTEVYCEAIRRVLEAGQSALVLVPEVGLTPQIMARFQQRLWEWRESLAVWHSYMSDGERYDAWLRIKRGIARIVVGARSAIFAPMKDLGLIVVDEEHEQSYKNEECPNYHARDLAVWRGKRERARVVLGSATPSLESWYNAQRGKYRLVELKKRFGGQALPVVHVLDQRRTKGALIHPMLKTAVEETIKRGEQVILLLNRRGYAPVLQCEDCGEVVMCPHCSVALNYHRAREKLVCHLCDHQEERPPACRACGSVKLRLAGAGTQRLEEAIGNLFPAARIRRVDADSMRRKGAFQHALRAMEGGEVDILLGTQMIAKGLHFPQVSCVGVIHADQALHMPDFRAAERVFQLITQVAGRSGRSDRLGEVYVQTNTPYHSAIQLARHHDYRGFVEEELEFRRALNYPPWTRAVLITFSGPVEEKTRWVAEQINLRLRERLVKCAVVPEAPSPAPIHKVKDRYRYHIFIKTQQVRQTARELRDVLSGQTWPDGIRCTVDVDPYDLL